MKINQIKINGFGKIKNKEINLQDGINIIYGENETGKSTILKFISNTFYGASKNKNGKAISDFDKYKPWDGSEFSGKIKYTLDDNKTYEVFREFKKKLPSIFNEFGEDISKEFTNKGKELDFLEQQIKVDENTFLNTAIIGQQEVKLEQKDTNAIIQKISNLVDTGDDSISFKKTMDKINKLQNEKIGTDRTKQKPINIVQNNIKLLQDKIKKLETDREQYSKDKANKEEINDEINNLQDKKEELKSQKNQAESTKIENIENNFKKKKYGFFIIFSNLIFIINCCIIKNVFLGIVSAICMMISAFCLIKINQKLKENNSNISSNVEKEIENIDNKINKLKVETSIIDARFKDADEKLEDLTKTNEELTNQFQIKNELDSLNISFNIAKECLEKAYDEIKHNISPKFEKNLCDIITEITNGKYKNVSINDEQGLCVEIENGEYLPIERLSIGTIDEMYLSLRLSTLSEVTNEKLPIILDETFAYFDENRLKNVLEYLQDKNYDNQIIIFTCSDREENALKDLRIEYNYITLEN